MRISEITNAVRGYGLTVYNDGDRDICGFLDGSPVLIPSRVENDGNLRRLRFNEGKREIRSRGDIFCADAEIAALVREAVNEKLQRDADAANAFRVTHSGVTRRGKFVFVTVHVVSIQSGAPDIFKFTVEAPSYDVQYDGQAEFGKFISAFGLSEIGDTNELHGLTATVETHNGRPSFKRWAA
ncbi:MULTISPECIES: hypothetical protein [unclassified Rhizobium]|uniref:hypothetical protein n=1 Tax=unclassified Rhizobium TaxID=2613769 RepID=UPI000BE8FE14|nr:MULTISPECIES: hypothetical protein [unclassified Rhizobium]MDF0659692.1 hypothetical protein [Rhizobium sp. BC49]PDS85289.1 hypothetical protein CO654_12530 [Rhizobium sp. L18]